MNSVIRMIKTSFGLSEIGSVRDQNQDSYLLDIQRGHVAVADGLGGLPHGDKASKLVLKILSRELKRESGMPLHEIITLVNEEARTAGFQMDPSGFGTTLTLARCLPGKQSIEIAHVGDSAAILVRKDEVRVLTKEHTVAARMAAEAWQDASEAIPLSAHHTLTQCMGQELYIDPDVFDLSIESGDRLFLVTDGVTKALQESKLAQSLKAKGPIGRLCQGLTFLIEAAGSPDNYTIVGVEF